MVIAAGGVQAARLIGSRQNPLLLAQIVTNPDGSQCKSPCVFGIQNGRTATEQAVNLLKAHPLTRQASLDVVGGKITVQDSKFYAVFHEDGLRHVELDVLALNEQANLANVVVSVGVPECVEFRGLGSITVFYNRYKLDVHVFDPLYQAPDRFRFEMQILAITFRDYWECPAEISQRKLRNYRMSSWQGFVSYARYDDYIRNHP
jgi:hypothetical protein